MSVSPKLRQLNTLRNQMLVGFLIVMMVILAMVGVGTYDSVSTLLKNNAEKQITQTAVQGNRRLEAVLHQIDSLTTQVAVNAYVQKLLAGERSGRSSTFTEQQALVPQVSIIPTYAGGVHSVELYTHGGRGLYPLGGKELESKVSREWIAKALENKGGIVWLGIDPQYPGTVTALRSIHLVNQDFAPGGYLLVRLERDVFRIEEPLAGMGEQEISLLVDQEGRRITGSDDVALTEPVRGLMDSTEPVVRIGDRQYVMVKQRSAITGWTLLILTPVSAITEGISVLRTAILASAGIGTLLFIILSFVLSTLITRPILKLIKTMRGARFGVLKPSEQVSSTLEIHELTHSYNGMVEDTNRLIRLVYEKELLQSRTELKALQAQIHPHFLFNTLEALYWSLIDKEEEELAGFVIAMSDLFRYTISGLNKEEWVTLAEELEQVERYMSIMTMRFGDRLDWQIVSSPDDAEVKLPKLLIQPLVENAIQHGLESRVGQGSVKITAARSSGEDRLTITVEDNGGGMNGESLAGLKLALAEGREWSSKGSGLGLANVRRRLRLYYGSGGAGDEEPLEIASSKGKGTVVKLSIPVEKGEQA
ncbi:sensor histidine kinase [Paenibacillus sp. KR2-11]|uniref:sensor histidine kinase n=1 Tax=Paenibacillus sp. KR2-11 TaxID=3385500 RepID=UPI0038FBE7D3